MGNKIYTLSNNGSSAVGKPVEPKTIKFEIYSDISMKGNRQKNGKIKIAKNIDVKAVKTSIDNLFKFLPGERVLNPDFGNKLYTILYGPIIDHTKELVAAEIKNMISKYEPRAVIDNIFDNTSLNNTEDNTAKFIIEWHVLGFDNTKYKIPLP